MRILIILFLLGVSSTLHAERIDQTRKVEPAGNITVDVVSGEVEIIGWNKPEVRVVGSASNAKEDFVFRTNGNDTHIEVESKHGFWGSSNRGSASLKIYCPVNSSVRIEGASTEFSIKGMSASVNASTVSGDIDLDGGAGKVSLESVSGDVTVVNAKGRLNLGSVSGDVIADVLARFFDAETVSGSI